MTKVLNSSNTCEVSMGDVRESTILENTAIKLARELGISFEETDKSGSTYAQNLEGENERIRVEYHRDFDGYESFDAYRGEARFAVSRLVTGSYTIDLKNSGKNLLAGARQKCKNDLEKRIAKSFVLSLAMVKNPAGIYEPVFDIREAEIDLITADILLRYTP